MRKRPMPPVEIITRMLRIAPATERAIDAVLGKRREAERFPSRREIEAEFRDARRRRA